MQKVIEYAEAEATCKIARTSLLTDSKKTHLVWHVYILCSRRWRLTKCRRDIADETVKERLVALDTETVSKSDVAISKVSATGAGSMRRTCTYPLYCIKTGRYCG
jgi:hypothetical protein